MNNYFEFIISPPSEGGTGLVRVINFHPKWKDAAALVNENEMVKQIVEEYASNIENWCNSFPDSLKEEIKIEWGELGLESVKVGDRKGAFLDGGKYSSHNIDRPIEAFMTWAVLHSYIDQLNVAIEQLEK